MKKDYSGKVTPMSIAAFVLSLLFCTAIVGVILGIIDLTQKDGRKKGLSIAAVSVGGLCLILSIAAGISGYNDKKTDSSNNKEVVEEVVEKTTPEPTEKSNKDEIVDEGPVELVVAIEPIATWDGNNTKIEISTNLPDEAELMLTLSSGDYNTDDSWTRQTKVTVNDGKAVTNEFSDNGKKLSGDCDLCVSMSLPRLQSDAVRAVVGEKGEYMTGPLVEDSEIGDSKVVSALFSVSFGDDISVKPEDDYTYTIFRAEEEDTEEDVSDVSDTTVDEDEIKSLVAAAEVILKQNFNDNYNISYEDKMVTINLWQSGITLGAIGVQAGTISKKDWNYMVNGVQSLSESVYKIFEPYDVNVNVNVLNDVNKENTLLSFLNGAKFYDVVDN